MPGSRVTTSFAGLAAAELERRPQTASAPPPLRTSASQPVVTGTGEIPTPREWLLDPPRDLTGLALSGGGIRSATFNLGLLQGLHSLGLLPAFDYLSTVSGGGYIGAFWSAWRARQSTGIQVARDTGFPLHGRSRFAEPTEIRHLREFSNFLIPRLGVLSYDTGRAVVAMASGMVPSLLAALSVIVIALFAALGFSRVAFGPYLYDGSLKVIAKEFSLGLLMLVTALTLYVSERRWCKHEHEENRQDYPRAMAVGTLLVGVIWMAAWRTGMGLYHPYGGVPSMFLPIIGDGRRWVEWLALLIPTVVWYMAALLVMAGRDLTSRFAAGGPIFKATRAAFDRVTSRLVFLGTSWLVVTLLWYAGVLVWYALVQSGRASTAQALTGLGGAAAAVAALFANVHRFFSQQPNKPFGGRAMAMVKQKLPQLLAYASVVMLVIGAVVLLVSLAEWHWIALWGALFGAGIIAGLIILFFDPNEFGLHPFYRGRLARAYLGASNPDLRTSRRAEEQRGDDLLLTELNAAPPLHLVCLTANDIGSRDQLANLSRGAESAVLSRVGFSVGDKCACWGSSVPPTLAGAITASGAAFNSQMGGKSMELGPAVTFLMTALNLRLGLWWRHPDHLGEPRPWSPGWRFFEEMFGRTAATARDVHLSDGGHFENMAIYELVRRHCRYIVASDCGADPDVAFDDFGNLVRRVREDFSVEIVIDLSPLKPERGLSRQPMVAGDIHYPGGDVGVLLLFKPTLVGNEPADITQYKTRNAAFPHESTGDQFYDEAQWESYRRLGEFAARSAFRGLATGKPALRPEDGTDELVAARRWMTRVFARARRQWLPAPAGYVERLAEVVAQASAIDALLHDKHDQVVLRQVYKEVNELGTPAQDGPRQAAGAAGRESVLPNDATLAQSLHVIRRALLFMEEVFLAEDIGHRYNHPLYLGLMNYFARWAYAPLFRLWWPLLKTLYAEPFTSFMERQFNLTGVDPDHAAGVEAIEKTPGEKVVVELKEGGGGFAKHCWALQNGRQLESTAEVPEKLVSYRLCTRYRGFGQDEHVYLVQAAQVIARFPRHAKVVMWDAQDFFVPPGLWGVGIGEDFVSRLARGEGPIDDVEHLLVRIGVDLNTAPSARKEGADETQLYRSTGFLELLPQEVPCEVDRTKTERWLLLHDKRIVNVAAFTIKDAKKPDSRWMMRCVSGKCPHHPSREIHEGGVQLPPGSPPPGMPPFIPTSAQPRVSA